MKLFKYLLLLLIVPLTIEAQNKHTRSYIPLNKGLTDKYINSLFEKGKQTIYQNKSLKYVAMPCGGIGAGQVEILGSGKLCFYSDIYNKMQRANGGHGYSTGYQYLHPSVSKSKIENNFSIGIEDTKGKMHYYKLNNNDFNNIKFIGEYPIAKLKYEDANKKLPIAIESEIYTSYNPQDVRASANPMVIIQYKIKNISKHKIKARLAGLMKGITSNNKNITYQNKITKQSKFTSLTFDMLTKDSTTIFNSDYGNMSLAIIGKNAKALTNCKKISNISIKQKNNNYNITKNPYAGTVYSDLKLSPNQEKVITFVISWYFPNYFEDYKANYQKKGLTKSAGRVGHIYNNWYNSSIDIIKYVAKNIDTIEKNTHLFHDTYFDTTIPYWLTNRIIMSLSSLSCGAVNIWQNGRFYSYEGISFCPGTCGHVYNFVATVAKLFPSLERSVRIKQDFNENNGYNNCGRINFRGHDANIAGIDHSWASDAQSGYVLKVYREHLMSNDNSFLDKLWPKVKMAIGYQIFKDGAEIGLKPNGVLECEQTFWDPMWYGPNPYNNVLYLAALRAAEEMARIENDNLLADRYHYLFKQGTEFMNNIMWNGEYYVHLYPWGMLGRIGKDNGFKLPNELDIEAKSYIKNFNNGKPTYFKSTECDANQLFGQNWANQLGLGNILPPERCKKAMLSVFKYNWTPNISTVYKFQKPRHRILAAPGEAAMVNGSWPKEAPKDFENTHDKSDIWTGLEYDACCDMINAGLLKEAFIVLKSIDNNYNGANRNPWNEIEGSNHYSRAMQSWNILQCLAGFEYNGPKGILSFSPKLNPNNYKSFFSVAEGWGTYKQVKDDNNISYSINIKMGHLSLSSLSLPNYYKSKTYDCLLNNKKIKALVTTNKNRIIIKASLKLKKNDVLSIISK